MIRQLTLLLVFVALLFPCRQSLAQNYRFSGTITSVPEALSTLYTVGQPINGDMITGGLPLEQVGDDYARYSHVKLRAVSGSDRGGFIFRTGYIDIYDNSSGIPDQVKLTVNDFIRAPTPPGHTFTNFIFDLQYKPGDFTGVAFRQQFAPATLRDDSRISYDDGALFVGFMLSNFSVLPEPSALILAAVGRAMCIFRSRRLRSFKMDNRRDRDKSNQSDD